MVGVVVVVVVVVLVVGRGVVVSLHGTETFVAFRLTRRTYSTIVKYGCGYWDIMIMALYTYW